MAFVWDSRSPGVQKSLGHENHVGQTVCPMVQGMFRVSVCVCQSFYNGYELYRFSRMESGQWLLDGRLYQGEHAPRAYAPRAP